MKTTQRDDVRPEDAVIGDIQADFRERIAILEGRVQRHLSLMQSLNERVDRVETVMRISGRA